MPRTRAGDYDDKRTQVLDVAAALFGEFGYTGTKMEQIAERCNVSKSMVYHYFKKKEDVLFDIQQEHVLGLISAVETYIKQNQAANPDDFFRGFVQVYLEPAPKVRARHVVAMVEMRYLTDKQKARQVKLERRFLTLVDSVLAKVNPEVEPVDRKVFCLLLVGMMNWIELWYKSSGKLSPAELYKMIGHLFLHGFLEVGAKAKRAPATVAA
ncbi:TetR/AcrR family transcriptional regulator [soil metagenome]